MKKEWYVVITNSGNEKRVKRKLKTKAKSMGMQDYISRIIIPEITEVDIKNGFQNETTKKMFSGYVLVEMVMNDKTWDIVRNTRGVTGFIGSSRKGTKPTPLLPQIDKILANMGVCRIDIESEMTSDKVNIIDIPSKGNTMNQEEENYIQLVISGWQEDSELEQLTMKGWNLETEEEPCDIETLPTNIDNQTLQATSPITEIDSIEPIKRIEVKESSEDLNSSMNNKAIESTIPTPMDKTANEENNQVVEIPKYRLPIKLEQKLLELKKELILKNQDSIFKLNDEFFDAIDRVLASENINARSDYTNKTLLEYSIKWGEYELVEELLLYGADPNALNTAIMKLDKKMVKLLLAYGASIVNYKLFESDSARKELLSMVKSYNFGTSGKILTLTEGDYKKSKVLTTNLKEALKEVISLSYDSSLNEHINNVLSSNEVDFQNWAGETLLMYFAAVDVQYVFKTSVHSLDIMRMLLENHSNPNVITPENDTALLYANNIEKIKLLLDAGTDVSNVSVTDLMFMFELDEQESLGLTEDEIYQRKRVILEPLLDTYSK